MSGVSARQVRRVLKVLQPAVEKNATAMRHNLIQVEIAFERENLEEAVIIANAVLARADALADSLMAIFKTLVDLSRLEEEIAAKPRAVKRMVEELESTGEKLKDIIVKLSLKKYTSRADAALVEKVCKPLGVAVNVLSTIKKLLILAGLKVEEGG